MALLDGQGALYLLAGALAAVGLALEAAAALAWPATIERSAGGGWLLRATPGLDRGRSNNALTPSRELLRQAAADADPHPPGRRDWPARADPIDSAGSEWADGHRSRQRRLACGLGSLRART